MSELQCEETVSGCGSKLYSYRIDRNIVGKIWEIDPVRLRLPPGEPLFQVASIEDEIERVPLETQSSRLDAESLLKDY